MLASTAVRAAVIGDPGVDHHPVAGPDRANLSTHRLHDAGSVGTEDVRVAVFVRQPAHDEEIEVVERRRAQRYAYLPRLQGPREVRDIGGLELVEAARAADHPGAHGVGAGRDGQKAGDHIWLAPAGGVPLLHAVAG